MADRSTSNSRGLIVGISATVVVIASIFVAKYFLRDKVEVRTAKASYQDLNSVVSTNGKVEPIGDYQAHASAPGVVRKVSVEVGQHVERGAELLRMDDKDARMRVAAAHASLDGAVTTLKNMQSGGSADELLSASADLNTARNQQRQAATTLSTIEALQAKGSASANEVAVARQRLIDAQTRISQLEARSHGRYSSTDIGAQQALVHQAQVALVAAEAALGTVDFRAPFSGTIYSVPVSDFDFVQGGEALLNMADLHRLQVRAYFDEPEIGKLANGQPVKIVWDAKPYASWQGHIDRAPTTIITYGTRNVGECFITVDDAGGDLLPNTNVTVTVTVSQLTNVLSLPREALRTEGVHDYVYRIVDGHLRQTPIQVGAVNLTRVQILSGLNNGDVVATSATSNAEFKDGLEVKALQ